MKKSLTKKDVKPGYDRSGFEDLDDATDAGADDVMQAPDSKKQRKPWSLKKKILLVSLAVVFAALFGVGAYALSIWSNPMGEFKSIAEQVTPNHTELPPQVFDPEEPEPTINPYDELVSKADFSMLTDIVNIMLIGVDYAEERETWRGKKDFHADVMIVLAINTKTNKVDMISLPRDTYANIPGVSGIYKLNASIDCGGGWPTESGFKKVCESASWMLGGMPVDYYYAVDMNAVKALVDQVGGIDFEVEFDYKLQGRSYTAGLQHLDGQGVLDYLRVRKNIPAQHQGDLRRINRQKAVLIKIFEKVKSSDLIFRLPEMLDSFEGNYFTNTTFGQTAGLAAFFYKINSEDISMHSMDGATRNIFNWNFVLTNQKKRVDIIESVYGVKVSQYTEFTAERATFLWESMQAEVIIPLSRDVLNKVKHILDADALQPVQPAPQPAPLPDPDAPPDAPPPTPPPIPEPPPGGWRKYADTDAVWQRYHSAEAQYSALVSWSKKYVSKDNTTAYQQTNMQLKTDVEAFCAMFSIPLPDWKVKYEKESNQILVDFN